MALFDATVKAPPPPRDDPTSVSVIELGLPGQAGAPSAYKVSLAEVLAGQPGLQIRRTGGLGQYSSALLRGADANQIAVLIDGVPLQRGAQAAADLSQLAVDGVERVEVYRGLPPLEVGIDAIGGAINLISRRGSGPGTLWALFGSGSFGLRKLSAGHTGERAGVRVAATVNYQGATGDFPYLSTGGLLYSGQLVELVRRNDSFDQLTANVRLSGESSHGSYFLAGQGLLKQQGIAGIGQAAAQPGQPLLQSGRALLTGGGQARLRDGQLELSVDGHVLVERSALADRELEPPTNVEQLSEQAGVRTVLRLHSAPAEKSRRPERSLLLLGEFRYEHLGSADLCPAPRRDCASALPTESERLRGVLGLGGELRFAGDRLLVQPGAHLLLSRSRLRPLAGVSAAEPLSADESFLAPRLAARLVVAPWLLLRASGGRFVRLPTFLELFGDRATFRPNLALRRESAWLLEAGGRALYTPAARPWLRLSLEAHGFARLIDDLIDTVRDGPTLRADNVGQALAAGVELSGRAELGEIFSAQANYSFLEARNRTMRPGRAGNFLPGRPPHSLFLRLDLGYRAWRVAYELDYASLLYLDPANLQPRPARALHALLLQSGPHGAGHLTLIVELRNLADERALPVTLPLAAGPPRLVPLADIYDYPLPGRALYATLSGRF